MWVWERKLSKKLLENGCTNIISLLSIIYLNLKIIFLRTSTTTYISKGEN